MVACYAQAFDLITLPADNELISVKDNTARIKISALSRKAPRCDVIKEAKCIRRADFALSCLMYMQISEYGLVQEDQFKMLIQQINEKAVIKLCFNSLS